MGEYDESKVQIVKFERCKIVWRMGRVNALSMPQIKKERGREKREVASGNEETSNLKMFSETH